MTKPTEYEFSLLDGSKRYEMVCQLSEAFQFQRMHKARSFKPVEQCHPVERPDATA